MLTEEWNTFEKTGNVCDYLRYCQEKEKEQQKSGKEHGTETERDRNGTFRSTSW
ncbi:MAG: hypothetical protein ACI4HI_12155 [Lachnospiraceae bacterium]